MYVLRFSAADVDPAGKEDLEKLQIATTAPGIDR